MTSASALARFRSAYAAHRAAEGRRFERTQLLELPYLTSGPLAPQWDVRARTFDAFVRRLLAPMVSRLERPVRLLDLGAGNGWLSWRVAAMGVESTAIDLRDDAVDGLRAGTPYLECGKASFHRVVASFDALPVSPASFDVVVFNASLHYSLDLAAVLREARRVLDTGGRVAILDSPFYARDRDGQAMMDEKLRRASETFGEHAAALTALPFVEYLTRARLTSASVEARLTWRRHRVSYPWWYEVRPWRACLRGERRPSRFDLWEGLAQ